LASVEAPFHPEDFLAKIGEGRTIGKYRKRQNLFAQGNVADSVFYIQKGRVKLTVLSEHGKEAVVALLGKDEFCGEGCLAGQPRRLATATALSECEIMRIDKDAIVRTLH
jgi:CRP/FNR family cyclic AMP-dependent transcriptional regulator